MRDHRLGTVIAFATAEGRVASDVGMDGGPYARALAEELVRPGRNDQEVFNAVRNRVVAEVDGQVPWTRDGLVGERVVFKPLQDGEATTDRQAEITLWESVKNSEDRAQIKVYLKVYPTGLFAEQAVEIIAQLEKSREKRLLQEQHERERRAAEIARIQAERAQLEAERLAAEARANKSAEKLRLANAKIAKARDEIRKADLKKEAAEAAVEDDERAGQQLTDERKTQQSISDTASAAWTEVKNSNDPRKYRIFRAQFSESGYARLAEEKLAALELKRASTPLEQDQASSGGPKSPLRTSETLRANLATATVLRSVEVSPDRSIIAVTGDDGIVRIINAQSLNLKRSFPASSDGIVTKALAFSGDGSRIIAGRFNGKARIWHTKTGKLDKVLESRSRKIFSVGYYQQANNRYAVTAGTERVEIWNLQRKRVVSRPRSHTGTVRAVAYSSTRTGNFVTGGEDGRLVFYLPGNQQRPVQAHRGTVFSAVFARDNSFVVSGGGDGRVKIWDAQKQVLQSTLSDHSRYVLSVAVSQDGVLVASGGGDRIIRIWSRKSSHLMKRLAGHQKDVEAVRFLHGGAVLVSVSEDKTLRLWNVATGEQIATAVFYADGDYLAFTPDGYVTATERARRRLEVSSAGRTRSLTNDDWDRMLKPSGIAEQLDLPDR